MIYLSLHWFVYNKLVKVNILEVVNEEKWLHVNVDLIHIQKYIDLCYDLNTFHIQGL